MSTSNLLMTTAETVTTPPTSPTQKVDVTVAIPTYNGAKKLPALLEKLRSQTRTEHLNWEIIVCDNNSSDDTRDVIRSYQADWPDHAPLHYRFGAQQGAAFARQRAVEKAKGELIAFLDDDNLPESDWVFQAHQFAQQHPDAGAFGSQIHGKFESELPDELANIKTFLAIIERGDQPTRYEPAKKMLPPAAGLVVRRQAWLDNVPKRLFLNNTSKDAGLASEDLEALLHIQKSGWDVWYNPNMVVHHDIPDGRLKKDYLLTLFRCVGLSCFHIRMLHAKPWRRPFDVPAHIANDIRKLALHRMRYGEQQQLNTLESCEREKLANAVKSPFFLLRKSYNDKLQDFQDKQQPEQQHWLEQLTQAFEEDQFTLYQQPVVSLAQADSHIVTATTADQSELLLRLRNGSNDDVLPSYFLPTARRYRLMRTIDRWVISHLFDWVQQQAPTLSQLSGDQLRHSEALYAINLSQESVQDKTLADFIANKLAKVNLPASLFCFEIPAAVALAAPEAIRKLSQALHTLGCKITLDDVTISRSTVELITQLPISHIKLTPAMVKTIRLGSSPWSTLNGIMATHPVQAIAKGIESQASLDAIQEQGIRYAQGYQTGRPSPL